MHIYSIKQTITSLISTTKLYIFIGEEKLKTAWILTCRLTNATPSPTAQEELMHYKTAVKNPNIECTKSILKSPFLRILYYKEDFVKINFTDLETV